MQLNNTVICHNLTILSIFLKTFIPLEIMSIYYLLSEESPYHPTWLHIYTIFKI